MLTSTVGDAESQLASTIRVHKLISFHCHCNSYGSESAISLEPPMRKSISEHTFLDSRCPLLSFRGAVLFITLTLGSNQLQVRVFLSPTNVKSILGTGLFTGFSYMNRLLFISHSFSIDPLHLCIGSSFHFLEIGLITHSHELVDNIFQIVLLTD